MWVVLSNHGTIYSDAKGNIAFDTEEEAVMYIYRLGEAGYFETVEVKSRSKDVDKAKV